VRNIYLLPLPFSCRLSSVSNHYYRTFAYTNVFVGCMMISPQFDSVAISPPPPPPPPPRPPYGKKKNHSL
jgi:hypothetical protein